MVAVPDNGLAMVAVPDDGLAMAVAIPQLGDRTMPIVVEEYIPQPGHHRPLHPIHRSKRIKMMKEKEKKEE
jgi:hypothetical protein